MNNPVKLILFDFDGTIADSFPMYIRLLNQLSPLYHFKKITPHRFDQLRNERLRVIFKDLGISLLKLPFIIRRVYSQIDDEMVSIQPFDGLPEVLKTLKQQNHILGVITYNQPANVDIFLKRWNLSDDFDFVVGANRIWGKTPKIRRLVKQYQLKSDQAIFVGDEHRDILAAHQAGIAAIAVTWGLHSKAFLAKHKPEYFVSLPEELLRAVQQYFNRNT